MRNFHYILFFLITTVSFSQDNAHSFTLQEAIDYAIENNRTAKNAARDIDAAKAQKWETTAIGLPQIDANVDYQNWIKQQVSLLPAEIAGGAPGTFVAVPFGTKQTMNAAVTLNQKLFDGSYLVGLQSAKVFLQISEMAKEKTDLEVRLNVVNAYGNVLMSQEALIILENNIATVEKNLNETIKFFENGLTEEENVEQLQITLSGLKSKLNHTQRLNDVSLQMLNITIGLDLNIATQLTDTLELLALNHLESSILTVEDNVENTIDYLIAKNDLRSKELLVKLEKSKALPQLDAFVNAGYSGNNDEFRFVEKSQEWFGSSLLGVSMKIPIFSSLKRSSATQRAKINFEKAADDLTETEEQLKLQIATAKSSFQFAIEDYENKKLNVELAERIQNKNEIKFFEGIASSFDLTQAQTQLYTAQQDYLQAMLDVINTRAELETVLNTTNN